MAAPSKVPRSATPTPGPLRPIEFEMAVGAVKRGLVVLPLLVVLFWVLRDVAGAVGAAVGGLIVVGNFLVAGWIMSVSARRSLAVYHAAALLGVVLRLSLIILTVVVMTAMLKPDRVALGISAVVVYLTLLALETMTLTKRERKIV